MKTINKYSRKYVFDVEGNLLPIKERTYVTNEGYGCVLTDGGIQPDHVLCTIDGRPFEKRIKNVLNKMLKNPYHRSVFSIGYFGEGNYSRAKHKEAYKLWYHMLTRAYDEKYHSKQPTYTDVEVCDEWLNFQNFAEWLYNVSNYQDNWAMDKDLLSQDSKVYSPNTCVFIPKELNNFMTNIRSTNTSGKVGVHWNKQKCMYTSSICLVETTKLHYLGKFETVEEASEAYQTARAEQVQIWKGRMENILPQHAIDAIK